MSDDKLAGARPVATADDVAELIAARDVPRLIASLDHPNWVVRRSVISGLALLGDAAVPALVETLVQRRDSETRIAAAVDALVASTGEASAEVERVMARAPNPAVVADAAQILGRRRDAHAVPTLMVLLRHPDDNVAVAATEALGRIGGRAAVDALLDAVGTGSFFRVFPAVDVLGSSGDPRAVPALARLLDNPMYAPEAARALGRIGEKLAAAPLVSLLSRPTDSLARLAARSLFDLQVRHRARYGASTAVDEEIRRNFVGGEPWARRLEQLLPGAEPQDQIAISYLLGLVGGDSAVPVLTRIVQAGQEAAPAAAEALRKLGQEGDSDALGILRTGDSAARKALLPVISRFHATEAVMACLGDPDASVRVLACETLARIGNPMATRRLFQLLSDPNPAVVQAAVGAIQSLGSREVEPLALQAARAPAVPVRRAALRILSYFGYASAVEVFFEALKDSDPKLRDAALQGLPFLEDRRALEAIFEAAKAPSEKTRASAMRALGFASGDLRIHAFLLAGVDDPDPWVRYYAVQALGRLGVSAAAEKLVGRLADEAGQVRVAVVEALALLESDVAQRALEQAATSTEEDVRRAALIGLGMTRKESAIPRLLDAVRARDAATRLVAVSALSDFHAPEVTRAIAEAMKDPDEAVRSAAVGFLGGRRGIENTRELVKALSVPEVRANVQAALAIIVEGRIDGLLEALETANDELAPELTSALARSHRVEAAGALLQAIRSQNPAARKAAASTLSALGTAEAFAALREHAASDPDPEVRRICALLLAG